MPGGSRLHVAVWNDGKAPRYWVVLAVALLVFSLSWILIVYYLPSFAATMPDRTHSVAVMGGAHVRYYPPVIFWIASHGLFIVMAWIFILGLIMAFKRTMILKGKR